MDTQTICNIVNQVFRLSIPVELHAMRDSFCPVKGSIKCNRSCPIHRKYWHEGLSCNGALDKHPEDCVSMMNAASEVFA